MTSWNCECGQRCNEEDTCSECGLQRDPFAKYAKEANERWAAWVSDEVIRAASKRVPDRAARVLDKVIADVERDTRYRDGPSVGTMFRNQGAAITAIAKIVKQMVVKLGGVS